MKKKLLILGVLFAFSVSGNVFSQTKSDSTEVKTSKNNVKIKKEEENRNVMLNAENNTGPRSVNIGLPFRGDITILENGVPVVQSFFPTLPTATWRYDNSLAEMGLLSFAESALTFGKVGFAVKSSDRTASSSFKGYASMYINSFGSSIYDATVTGPLGKKGWGYTVSLYECFDRGSGTDFGYTPWTDRTEMVKLGISKKYKKGDIQFLYKMGNSKIQIMRYNPLVYEGNGNTSSLDNFKLGQDSYVLRNGKIPYFDALTGEKGYADLTDDKYSSNLSHNFYLSGQHNFDSGWKLNYSSMYQDMKAPFAISFPLSLLINDPDQRNGMKYNYFGTNKEYTGSVQSVVTQMMPQSENKYWVTMAEMTKNIKDHKVRLGFTHQYYSLKSQTNSGFFLQTVEPMPEQLDGYMVIPGVGEIKITDNDYGLYPARAGGYGSTTNYSMNKTALYASDDFSLGKRLDLSFGARIEHQNMRELKNPYINDFANGRPFVKHDFDNNWNKVGTASAVVKLTGKLGLLADVTYNSWNDRYWDYPYRDANNNPIPDPSTPTAKPMQTVPNTFETSVLNFGGGLYYNHGTALSIVSKLTRISKDNILTSQSITNPSNTSERMVFDPIFYDISTMGWSTDIVAKPFKNFNLHFLLTLQKPEYKNYQYSAFGVGYNYSNNIIPELSQTLMEIDPSYTIKNGAMRFWLSLRYFGKQYGNPTNAFEYNGWWENFGGIDYRLSRKVNLKLQVVNFLDQTGVKGTMQGADQITDATPFIGRKIVANGIRPRTIEFTVAFKF